TSQLIDDPTFTASEIKHQRIRVNFHAQFPQHILEEIRLEASVFPYTHICMHRFIHRFVFPIQFAQSTNQSHSSIHVKSRTAQNKEKDETPDRECRNFSTFSEACWSHRMHFLTEKSIS